MKTAMRRNILSTLSVTFLLLISGIGFAAQTIVVDMDPPAKSDSQSGAASKHEARGSGSLASRKASNTQQASNGKDVAIGLVGVITAPRAGIKRLPSRRSRNLYTCPKDTYLAVTGEKGAWYAVLMTDTSVGWIEKKKVNLLDYRVTNSSIAGQTSTTGTSTTGNRIVDTALRCLGISYKWGGYSLDGIDCSGFVKAVFAHCGISLPRTAREQVLVGTAVGWSELQPGDRLYFSCKGKYIDHCGIYIGHGYFIHSSVRNRGVAVDPITKAFFANSLVAARRSAQFHVTHG
jgi:cell wall-associated NlpC family hydrolase